MINETQAKKFCKDDISRIENYDKAIADTTQTWVCHHKLGLTLDGEFAHSRDELKRLGMYFHRPYFELIFLTQSEHKQIHQTGKHRSEDTRKKISAAKQGTVFSEEHRRKIGEAKKGTHRSAETKLKISESQKGRTSPMKSKKHSEESRRKISEAAKRRWSLHKQQQ